MSVISPPEDNPNASVLFQKKKLSDGEFYIPSENKEEIPSFVVFIMQFFCFFLSLIVGIAAMFLLRKVIVPVIQEFFDQTQKIITIVILDQIKYFKVGKIQSMYLYIEIYFVIAFFGYFFTYLFKDQFFKQATDKKSSLLKSITDKKSNIKRAQIIFTMLLTPVQIYFTFNCGFYYIYGIFYSQPLFREAILSNEFQIAARNPLIVFFSILAVPYLAFGFLLGLMTPFFNDFFIMLCKSWKDFEFTNEQMKWIPFTQDHWLPYIQLYCILIPLAIRFYRYRKQKNTKSTEQEKIKEKIQEAIGEKFRRASLSQQKQNESPLKEREGTYGLEKTKFNKDYYFYIIPKWIVPEIAVAIIFPFLTYLLVNWGIYFTLSFAVRDLIKSNESESKPVSYGFMTLFFLIACFSLYKAVFEDQEEEFDDEEYDEEEENGEQDEIKDKTSKAILQPFLESKKSDLTKQVEEQVRKTYKDKKEKTDNEQEEMDQKKEEKRKLEDMHKKCLYFILCFFSLMAAVACYPEMDASIKFNCSMFLAFVSSFLVRSAIYSQQKGSSDKSDVYWIIISAVFFVFIFTKPLTVGLQCYANIIGKGDGVATYYLIQYDATNTDQQGWSLECHPSKFFEDHT